MLRLSRKTMLAVEAVLDIAYHGGTGTVQAKEITARQGVPQRYLEQVMQQLVHEGVLKGVRGPRGGYTLARDRKRVAVGEIVRIVSSLECADEGACSCSELGEKVVGPFWEKAQRRFLENLDEITIADLFDEAEKQEVARDASEGDNSVPTSH